VSRFNTPKQLVFFFLLLASVTQNYLLKAQDILPPVLPWKGKSEALIVKSDNPWITHTEKSNFATTPSYTETMEWFSKLCQASSGTMKMVSIGKSAQQRDINMVIASLDGKLNIEDIRDSGKPLVLIQAGIHSGEIDGKDAGMMMLRDIAFGKKKELLQDVNILFIPILSVDAHERVSPYNRVNQRGPENMGWRTNARNLNLNRDYSKLDTEEIRAVVKVINEFDPDLYLDLHVTDGADYQYDITYGFAESYSSASAAWLRNTLSPAIDQHLKDHGHIPGPLMFATNDKDFTQGNIEFPFIPRFSNTYGDLRHLPSILVENHSLKPFKQRVLGTYIFLEAVIKTIGKEGSALKKSIEQDKQLRNPEVVLSWKTSPKTDSMTLLGVESKKMKSEVTGKEYVTWTGKTVTSKIAFIRNTAPDKIAKRPKAYWIPSTYTDVIERLRLHGIVMEKITTPKEIEVKMFRITDHKFSSQPFEGHFSVKGTPEAETRKETFYPGSVRVSTDQPLGDLVMHLLEPDSEDSFLQWGFFMEIFSRTEYIEEYVVDPLAKKMLSTDAGLRQEFDTKKKNDPAFANDPQAIYEWFYTKSPYVDSRWLLYPVGVEE
jgi:hypothetical protein